MTGVNKLSTENIGELFSLTWFGNSLVASSGVKIWQDGSVCILNQPSYNLKIPINWLDDPYNHRSWRWVLNSFQWMDQLLARFKLKHDEEAIQSCAAYFLDWVNFYIVKKRDGEFLWKDDAVSFRTFRLAIVARYIFDSGLYSDEEVKITEKVLQQHYHELFDPKKFKSNNHGIFQMRALMNLLTLHPNIGDVEASKKYVTQRLNWLWTRQYGTQNMHLENSTGYHQYIIFEFDQILDSPELKKLKFVFNKNTLEEVKSNTKYLFHPNGTATLFGDTNFQQKQHEIVTGDHFFNEAGYAILAGDESTINNSYLVIRTGFPSNAHRHSDDFSFEWSEKGQIIFQDSGRFSYDYQNPYRVFVSSTRAHNTVSIDGGNYPWWGDFKKTDFYEGAVKSYRKFPNKVLIELEKEFDLLGVKYNRKLELERGKALYIVDSLESQSTRDYEQWFHFSEAFEFDTENSGNNLIFLSEKIELRVQPPENVEILIAKGQNEPFIQGWISYKERQILPRVSVGFIAKDKQHCVFKTKFEIVNL